MAAPIGSPKYDDVFVVLEKWDVPLSGIARFEGEFCCFQRVYDEAAQGWPQSREFMLQRLTAIELAQFNDMHDRYEAWLKAHKAGTAGPHPLTPEATGPDADRFKELHQLTQAVLFADTDRTVRCTGEILMLPNTTRYVAQWQRL